MLSGKSVHFYNGVTLLLLAHFTAYEKDFLLRQKREIIFPKDLAD